MDWTDIYDWTGTPDSSWERYDDQHGGGYFDHANQRIYHFGSSDLGFVQYPEDFTDGNGRPMGGGLLGFDAGGPQTGQTYAEYRAENFGWVDGLVQYGNQATAWADSIGPVNMFSDIARAFGSNGTGTVYMPPTVFLGTVDLPPPQNKTAGVHAGYSDGLPTDGGLASMGILNPAMPPLPKSGNTVAAITYENGSATILMVNGTSRTFPASSGKPGVTDPKIPDAGPIPPGLYFLNPSQISPTNWKREYIDPRDWGRFRVPLIPGPGTDTLGRSDFMLHGGERPGSAGCIDCGRNDVWLFPVLQRQPDKVPVIVYPPSTTGTGTGGGR